MQTLKIQCKNCEKEESFIFDGCLVFGIRLDGTVQFLQHELSGLELAKAITKNMSYEDLIKALHAGLHQYLGEQ